MGQFSARQAWLSITPEPERELPAAVAALRAGGAPSGAAVEAERARAERLVTRGTRRAWAAYLEEAGALARAIPEDAELGAARALVLDVIHNHDQLKLGLAGTKGTRMTISPAAPSSTTSADLTPEQQELRDRARRFVDEVLIPNEELAERAGGDIPEELHARIKRESIEARLSGGLHAEEYGGQGWSKTEWFLVEEQLGRSTNALSWHMPGAYNVLASGTPEQIDRYLRPALRGELHDAYAVTEADAGSDPSRIKTTARRTGDGWVIDGEKWFVTYGDVASVYIVMAKALVDGQEQPTLFLVDRASEGIELVDDPPVHAHLSARPPHHPLHRRGGARRRRGGRGRRRR